MSSYQFSYGHYVAYQGSVWEIESLDPKTKILNTILRSIRSPS